ncbi:Omp28-related outer membrane protein [Cochleicola gelatinilyticus]|uniref:Thioredoxin domain-containing protein n=1 Tax=Cochleicola gelatinilyticus TaxID=1763537 RepID=A0A167F2P0_9FLAO|nr:Omp28-related outer membrane protein [Cochleicola gelatinilyticus]OAB76128.1 hypothetical protein ULVI_13815 [Cochleicola gelatinilyticus]
MKLKKLVKLSIVLAAILTVLSCSKTEENVPLVASINLTSSSDDAILTVNETVDFTLIADTGEDYTNLAVFSVNQQEIPESSYTFTEPGTFDVFASYGGLNSNSISFTVVEENSRTLIVSTERALRNQTVTFTVVDGMGEDATSSSTFFVNGTEISGNEFSGSEVGAFEVYASYQEEEIDFTTETKTFDVFIPKRKVMIEDYTGTWCGFCPRINAAIDEVVNQTSDISIVAIHETSFSYPDPYDFEDIDILKAEFNLAGFPQGRINRTVIWATPYAASDIVDLAGAETNLAIGINSSINGNTLTIDVDAVFENGSNSGDKIVVYLTESGLIHPQVNYLNDDPTSPYFGQGDIIEDFEHNHVLRQSLTNVLGDPLAATGAYELYEKTYTTTIPTEYNRETLEIVVMITDADNNAKNSQHAKVNVNKLFD